MGLEREQKLTGTSCRRQHYIARFYLRNFAYPPFSENLCVFDIDQQRWRRRSSRSIGWVSDQYTTIGMNGEDDDGFDRFIAREVETAVAPAFRRLAQDVPMNDADRRAVSSFIGLTAARSPDVIETVTDRYLAKQGDAERRNLDSTALWGRLMARNRAPVSVRDFIKASVLDAASIWTQSICDRVYLWPWQLIRTTRENSFVASDAPVFMQRVPGIDFVSFPISSELALVAASDGRWNDQRDRSVEVAVMNRQTTRHATQFVVACREGFSGDEFVVRRATDQRHNHAQTVAWS